MNKLKDIEDITVNFNKEKHLIFGYTPMCGTCKISERMLDIANEILQLPKKIDLNFILNGVKRNKLCLFLFCCLCVERKR